LSTQITTTPSAPPGWPEFLRAHAAVTRALNAELVGEHGITLNDYEVLLRLAYAPDRRLRRVDLAESVVLTASGITRLLDGLERCGLVRKASCESDRRVVYAELTDGGYAKLREASGTHLGGIERLYAARFSDTELATRGDLLGRLAGDDDVPSTVE
jgi:DNA-binding MarR family transcriptional regulator